ncbi:MAG: TAXI family TRAP transporter solute-binding subunit [Geminicoccaceae bacterium]|nr:TAXI family TRAP transporter solute-binding subunit [Geminicoccaceae bacterium]
MLQKRRGVLAGAAMLAIGSFAIGDGAAAQGADRSYILTTATTGGTYYPVGVALATLIKVKLMNSDNIDMSAISSAGSGENIKLLRENQAQFAILQGLFGQWAWKGTGKVEADGQQANLRSITMLWQNVEQMVLATDLAETGTIDDLAALAGKPFSIGTKNSGTEGSGQTLLSNLGIDWQGFELVHQGYTPTAEGLQNGTILGGNLTGGPPVTAVTQAKASMGEALTVLDFTDEQMVRANGDGDLWTRYVVPAGTYPDQPKDINTVAQPNFLAVNADVDEEAVYLITKTIYENLPFLQNIHAATKAMSLEKATAGLPAPLHPGALRYFEEQGLEIPETLRGG